MPFPRCLSLKILLLTGSIHASDSDPEILGHRVLQQYSELLKAG